VVDHAYSFRCCRDGQEDRRRIDRLGESSLTRGRRSPMRRSEKRGCKGGAKHVIRGYLLGSARLFDLATCQFSARMHLHLSGVSAPMPAISRSSSMTLLAAPHSKGIRPTGWQDTPDISLKHGQGKKHHPKVSETYLDFTKQFECKFINSSY